MIFSGWPTSSPARVWPGTYPGVGTQLMCLLVPYRTYGGCLSNLAWLWLLRRDARTETEMTSFLGSGFRCFHNFHNFRQRNRGSAPGSSSCAVGCPSVLSGARLVLAGLSGGVGVLWGAILQQIRWIWSLPRLPDWNWRNRTDFFTTFLVGVQRCAPCQRVHKLGNIPVFSRTCNACVVGRAVLKYGRMSRCAYSHKSNST